MDRRSNGRESAATHASPARRLAPLVAGLGALVPAFMWAQTPRDTVPRDTMPRAAVLPAVQVRASIVPSAAPSAAMVVGSGVPARVTIVGGAALGAVRARVLPDALATQAGVSVYDDLGSPYKLNLGTRGFVAGPTVGLPAGVSVFLDGVRQNEPDAQEVNFDLLPLDRVERVELLSGTASLLGPNSLGGAINLVTRRGSGPPGGELSLTGGSFGTVRGDGAVSGRATTGVANGWDYALSGGYGRERGWRAATGAVHADGLLNLGHTGATRGVTLQAQAARSRAETAGSLPESLFGDAPRTNFTPGDVEDLNAQQLTVSGDAPALAGHGTVTLFARRSAAERFNVNQAPDPDVRGLTNNLTLGGTADWRRVVAVGAGAGAGTLALRVGIDGSASRVRVRIVDESDGGMNRTRTLATDVRSMPNADVAGYALADYHVGRATLSGGARYDHVRIPFRDVVADGDDAAETVSTYRHLSPRGGVSIDLGRGASLYASVGASFRAPAILELGCASPDAACPLPFALGDDPPLAPVRARTYEAGGRWTRGAVLVSASAYRTAVRDEIFFVSSPGALLSGYFTNLPHTRREGIEASVAGQSAGGSPHARVEWYANYAYTRATFRTAATLFSIRSDDDFADAASAGPNAVQPGARLPLVPAHQLKAGADLHDAAGRSVGVDARYVGRQWLRGDEANETSPLASYAVVGAHAGYALRRWQLVAAVANVADTHAAIFGTFNENRRSGALERFLTPMTARTMTLTLRRSIGGTPGVGA